MVNITQLVVIGAYSFLIAGCTHAGPTDPSPPTPALVVFQEPATGFFTSDVYDASGRVVHFTTAGDLLWPPDGTQIHGYAVDPNSWGPPTYFISRPLNSQGKCDGFCVFSIRFGSPNGEERRAYLTIDYGHYNPGTLVDVEVSSGALVVTQTASYPPGTPTLSGVVTESTPAGRVPLVGAFVYRGIPGGWQEALTDQNGFYELRGLIPGTNKVQVSVEGYHSESSDVTLDLAGDTRLDFELVRN